MNPARRSSRVRLAAGAMLVLAACGGGDEAADDPVEPSASPTSVPVETAPTSTPGQESAAATVPAALDFSAPLVGGGEIEMGEYAGRPVLLWFWAPW